MQRHEFRHQGARFGRPVQVQQCLYLADTGRGIVRIEGLRHAVTLQAPLAPATLEIHRPQRLVQMRIHRAHRHQCFGLALRVDKGVREGIDEHLRHVDVVTSPVGILLPCTGAAQPRRFAGLHRFQQGVGIVEAFAFDIRMDQQDPRFVGLRIVL